MVQYVFFHLKIQKQQFVSLILVEKMASPCYHGLFLPWKHRRKEGVISAFPLFFGKFMGRVGRARAPLSCMTFILTWSFLQDMCKLNDIHSRWCHQVTFLVEQKINDGEMLWNFIHEASIGFLFLRVMFFDDPFLPEITSPSTNHHLVTLFGEFWMCFASVITCFFCVLASKCSRQYRKKTQWLSSKFKKEKTPVTWGVLLG